MCLSTNWKNPRIAKRDITVWKKLFYRNRIDYPFKSICHNFVYMVDRLYKTKLTKRNTLQIKEGFHSFQTKKKAVTGRLKCDVIKKSIIPKGSQYYKSLDGIEIVSNQIIILDTK